MAKLELREHLISEGAWIHTRARPTLDLLGVCFLIPQYTLQCRPKATTRTEKQKQNRTIEPQLVQYNNSFLFSSTALMLFLVHLFR